MPYIASCLEAEAYMRDVDKHQSILRPNPSSPIKKERVPRVDAHYAL